MELYFAYGSNLWIGQMRERCPSTQVESIVTLKRHRMWFPVLSERWGAGVASIHEDEMGLVEGVAYRISWDDLKRMDEFEGVPSGMYRREEVTLHKPGGDSLRAWTYISRIDEGAPFATSESYINTIIRGAEHHGLSSDWIRFLRDVPVEESGESE